MSWRARFDRRRFLSPGVVVGGALRVWFRGLPVALMVVVLFGTPVAALIESDALHVNADLPGELAVTAFANTTAATWVGAVVALEDPPNARPALFAGVFALALCYAATGLVAALLHHRFAAGSWRGTSFLAMGRIVAFAAFVALVLTLLKALMIRVFTIGGMRWDAVILLPYLTVALTLLETWLICRHWLVLPILAIERVPLLTAIRRSRKLTRYSGFAISGLVLVFVVLTILLYTIQGATGWMDKHYARSIAPVAVLLTTLQAALLAESYRHLRELREGPDEHTVARVFD